VHCSLLVKAARRIRLRPASPGLSRIRANNDYQRAGNGGSGYFEYNLNKMVGLVADFGVVFRFGSK
jgi:hypothetical protein